MPLRKKKEHEPDQRGVKHELQRESAQMVVGECRKREPGHLDDERISDIQRVVVHPLVLSACGQPLEWRREVVEQRILANGKEIDLTNPPVPNTGRHRMINGIRREDDRTRRALIEPENGDARVHPLERNRDKGRGHEDALQPRLRRRKTPDGEPRRHCHGTM